MSQDTSPQQRIEQWEKMTRQAPDGMGFFSLGNAYRDAERYPEAAEALRRAIDLDPGLSRAYQLLGQVLLLLGEKGEAGRVLTSGYVIAAGKGDVMPQRAMESLLEKLGVPVPRVQAPKPPAAPTGDGKSIVDRRTGRPGPRLDGPPMKGPLGRFIFDHYSQETWNEWVRTGTKVINELRLDFSNMQHQDMYEAHMLEWLGFTREEAVEYARQNPPAK